MSKALFESSPTVAAFNRRWVAELWARRLDTADIAKTTLLPEHEVCQILARLQDERHAARTAASTRGAFR